MFLFHFSGLKSSEYFCAVVGDEPVVDVEGDKECGEAGDGDDVQNTGVVDQVDKTVLKLKAFHCYRKGVDIRVCQSLKKISCII